MFIPDQLVKLVQLIVGEERSLFFERWQSVTSAAITPGGAAEQYFTASWLRNLVETEQGYFPGGELLGSATREGRTDAGESVCYPTDPKEWTAINAASILGLARTGPDIRFIMKKGGARGIRHRG